MTERYFTDMPLQGDTVQLVGAEAQHLVKVMRASAGDEIVLFDGTGIECTARIAEIRRQEVRLDQLVCRPVDRELPFPLELGVALPKGDRQRWLVEKLTELGVTVLVPLITTRSVVRPDEGSLLRLRRTVIEASKQCGRNRLLQIALPQRWSDYVAGAGRGVVRWLAHPGAGALRQPSERLAPGPAAPGERRGSLPAGGPVPVSIAVGPEGGFTADEVVAAVEAGWTCVSLGPRILRVETAAVALAAAATVE
ncbi:MAG: 16S rRNA (uracil(1498)-N(3))-methyltransferase [Pirellulaceae bacterium]